MDRLSLHELDRLDDARDLRLDKDRGLGVELPDQIHPVADLLGLYRYHLDTHRGGSPEPTPGVRPVPASQSQSQAEHGSPPGEGFKGGF